LERRSLERRSLVWWRSGAAELAELGVAEFGAAELGAAGLGAGIAAAAAGAGVVVVQGCLSGAGGCGYCIRLLAGSGNADVQVAELGL
jgi:hypothetical protein